MSDDKQILADSQGAEAVNAVAIAAEASQKAQAAQIEAALESAMARFFSRGVQEKRFIDVGRIPFICDDLHGIHASLTEMNEKLDQKYVTKEQFSPVRVIVFGAALMVLVAFFGAVIINVIPHGTIAFP